MWKTSCTLLSCFFVTFSCVGVLYMFICIFSYVCRCTCTWTPVCVYMWMSKMDVRNHYQWLKHLSHGDRVNQTHTDTTWIQLVLPARLMRDPLSPASEAGVTGSRVPTEYLLKSRVSELWSSNWYGKYSANETPLQPSTPYGSVLVILDNNNISVYHVFHT